MILVSILGDFYSSILPVFYELSNGLNKHIIVYDDFKKDEKKALRVIESLKCYSEEKSLNLETIGYKIDEDSYEGILKLIDYIQSSYLDENTKVIINTTDGLSNINTILTQNLTQNNYNFLSYDRFDNQCNIVNQNRMETFKLSKTLPILEHFRLKGVVVKGRGDKSFALKYENEIKTIFRKYSNEYITFKTYAFQNSYLDDEKLFPNVAPIIKKMGLMDLNKNQVLLTGGMYEFYVYLLLKDLDFDDIEVGVVLHDFGTKEYFIPNEFDILLMKNNHLHMIECKFTNSTKKDFLVYKYISLQNMLDEDGKMMILTNDKKYSKELDFEDFTNALVWKRALHKDILLRGNIINNEKAFISEIKEHFAVVEKNL